MSGEPFDYHQPRAIMTFLDVTERKRTKEQLAKALQAVIQDTETFSQAVIEKLTEFDQPAPELQVCELTRREVLELMANGLANDCIGQELNLTMHIIRN